MTAVLDDGLPGNRPRPLWGTAAWNTTLHSSSLSPMRSSSENSSSSSNFPAWPSQGSTTAGVASSPRTASTRSRPCAPVGRAGGILVLASRQLCIAPQPAGHTSHTGRHGVPLTVRTASTNSSTWSRTKELRMLANLALEGLTATSAG